ncbi:MAG TPA: hypothetical protein VFG59_05390 [Anaeromyxobacter sp.]|nr:hypothetical protein [Anaeromyxobacter sp.]
MRGAAGSLALAAAVLFSTFWAAAAQKAGPAADLTALRRARDRFVPVDLGADLSRLPPSERATLARLLEASRILDALYLRQQWAQSEALLLKLAGDGTPLGQARLELFLLHKGPWDSVLDDRPFLPGVPEKPAQGTFYPADATRQEVERWAAGLGGAARDEALGCCTVIRRGPGRTLLAVPYAKEYQPELRAVSTLLREAARTTSERSLRTFLESRARAFETNAYRESDVAWMRVDGPIEATIGPYETYADRWFDAKAAFQAVIGIRDEAATAQVTRLAAELQGIEDALPEDPGQKDPRVGELAPMRVVDAVFLAGDAAQGVLTGGYNLPNDEWVQRTVGSKRVLLSNVQRAKVEKVLLPLARATLSPADARRVGFEPFFTHTAMHELLHGIGPKSVGGGPHAGPSVRAALGELFPPLEEAKADVGGLFALQKLLDEGKLDRSIEAGLYPTAVADAIRSVRFGLSEAHGKSSALQLAFYLDQGAIVARPDGTLAVDDGRMKEAVRSLLGEILAVQGSGDRPRGQKLLARGAMRPEIERVLLRLENVPVDLRPRWVTALALAGW